MAIARGCIAAVDVVSESGARVRPLGPFERGRRLGDAYVIDSVLASGGMGVVYDAHDVGLRRRVAIKAPVSAKFGPALRREAEALAALRSRAFVSVYHLGREEDVDYMVMERVFGESLASQLDDARHRGDAFPLDETLHILVALARGLAEAHVVGVSQRDLKPANIMLAADRVVILDLGLSVPEVLVGADNLAAGTPEYVAPEVVMRRVTRGGGPAVDLYALGVVAYEMLAGKTPFVHASVVDTLADHLHARPLDVRYFRDGVPDELAALIDELLAKDPCDRPPNAEAVAWRLAAIAATL
jgi:serine/threonine protein kinase